VPAQGRVQALDLHALALEGGLVRALEGGRVGRMGSLVDPGQLRLIEEDRRQIELVVNANHHANQQHEKLHGYLDQSVEEQAKRLSVMERAAR